MTRRAEILLLVAGIVAFVAACLLTRPIGITISDEVNYFTEAFALWRGWPMGRAGSYLLANGVVPFVGPRYPGGWPMVLAPFTALPWPWAFAANPIIHTLGAATMALVLRRRGLSPAWALLYLAQPTLLTFSRTLMAEPLAGLQTALLLLLASFENPFLLGLVAGFAPLIKLSQVIIVGPFVAVWLWRRPSGQVVAALRAGVGASVGLVGFLFFNQAAYGRWLAAEGLPTYAAPLAVISFLGLGLAELLVAWPLLPLGLLRSRAEEAVAVLCVFLYTGLYGYHYRGPNIAATLVVGARLHSSAIILLVPGYAAWLSSLGARLRRTGLVILAGVSLLAPILVLSSVAARRRQLENLRVATLERLRPGCVTGYSQGALKLLLPLPGDKNLRGPEEVATLDSDLARGLCVDLIDPLSEPSTYQHPPIARDPFAMLIQAWPHRDMSTREGIPVWWLDPQRATSSDKIDR